MNQTVLRNLAAATAVISKHCGGRVGMFFLIKAIYLADREMLTDYGSPITGDNYSSMPKGPMLSGLYNLLTKNDGLHDKKAQAQWDSAFSKDGNMVSVKDGASVNTDCLSPLEERVLCEKIDLIHKKDKEGVNIADWMHAECPEWETVPLGSSRKIPVKRVLTHAKKLSPEKAGQEESSILDGFTIRRGNLFSALSILR